MFNTPSQPAPVEKTVSGSGNSHSNNQNPKKGNGKAKVKGVKTSGGAAVAPPLPPSAASLVADIQKATDADQAHNLLSEALSQLSGSSQLAERIVLLVHFVKALGTAQLTIPSATWDVLADTTWAGFGASDGPSTTASADLVSALVHFPGPLSDNGPLKRLIAYVQAHMLRRQALLALEALWSGTGSLDVFFDQELFGPKPVATLYTGLLSVPRGVETNYRRRSRIAVALLDEDAQCLGIKLKKGLISFQGNTQDQNDAWKRWISSWVHPLAHTLIQTTMRQRSVIAAHHLPDLFALSRHALPQLLNELCSSSASSNTPDALRAPAVLTVLRVGKDMGLVTTGSDDALELGALPNLTQPPSISVPMSLLKLWAEAANAEVQVGTFGLLVSSKTLSSPLLESEREMIANYLVSTFVFVSPESRTAVRGYFIQVLDRIRAASHAASRVLSRRNASAEQKQQAQETMDSSRLFLQSLISLIRQHLHLGATYVATTQALSMLKSILADGVDPTYGVESAVKQRVGQYPFAVSVADEDMTQRLLEMVYSTYETTISASVQLLERFPRPLPGLNSVDLVQTKLVKPAQTLLLSAREHEAITAAALLQLYQTIYVPLDYPALQLVRNATPASVPLVLRPIHSLLDFLEVRMAAAAPAPEGKGLVGAALSDPLHGTLVSLQRAYRTLPRLGSDTEYNQQVRLTNTRVLKDLDAVWEIVSPILCSAAPEGNSGEMDEREAALGAEDELNEDEGTYTSALQGQGHRAQAVLHYSWRGIKEASTLLASVVSSTLSGTQDVWTTGELQSVGQTFQHWLLNVRHRGAFSTIYPALSRVATTVLTHAPLPEQRALPQSWLNRFLDIIGAPDAGALTITRRSAGLGYSVVALLTATVAARHLDPIGETITRLVEIAQLDGEDPKSQRKTPSIHAFNTLRYMIADKNLSTALRSQLGRLIPVAVDRFRSPLWSVRNAALMLYASLVTRIFTLQLANTHASPLSLTLPDLLGQFHGLGEFVRKELDQALASSQTTAADVRTTPLFAVLLLLARLRPPQNLHPVGEDLVQLIVPQLSSPLWQVREQAAWAITGLTPLAHAADRALSLVKQPDGGSNALHGAWYTAWILTRTVGPSSSLVELATQVQADKKVHPVVRHVAEKVASTSAPTEQVDEEGEVATEPVHGNTTTVLGPLLHSVYLKAQTSSAFAVSAADQGGDLAALVKRADETPCVPEKEQILLVLARRLASDNTHSDVTKAALQRIYAGTAEEEPDSTRTVALAALAQLPVSLYWGPGHVLGLAALLNLLADDELEIRLAAARLAARALVHLRATEQGVDAVASPQAPWSSLAAEGPLLGFTADRGIAMLYAYMASVSGPVAQAWDKYLVEQLLVDQDEWAVQHHRAFPGKTSLFEAERPNLYIDRIATVRNKLHAAVQMVVPRLVPELRSEIVAQAPVLLQHVQTLHSTLALSAPVTSMVEAEQTLLVTQLLAATELVLATSSTSSTTPSQPVDALAQAANYLRSVSTASLDTPHIAQRATSSSTA